jgi:cell division protein FtsQ
MKAIASSLETPADIKFVNGLTIVLFGLFILLMISSGFQYVIKNKIKNLDAIIITGSTDHSDVSSIRNIMTDNISGNFYNTDLTTAKRIFESMPWINHAVVKRVYPSLIEVRLSEYRAKAVWGSREDMKLVDESGSLFEVNTGDDDYESLPQLIGPEGQGKLMLDMYKNVSNAFSPLNNGLKNLELNARGSWIATLDGGAHIELGRGNKFEVIDRVTKFSMSAEKMLTKLNKKTIDLQYVDLRHSDGYALRMHGVSTLDLTIAPTPLKK